MRGRQETRLGAGVSLALGVVGVGAAVASIVMDNPLQHPIGPGYVPFGVSVCLAILALQDGALALRGSRHGGSQGEGAGHDPGPSEQAAAGDHVQWLLVAAWLALSIAAWYAAGYLVGMTLAVLGMMRIDHRVRLYRGLPFAVLLVLCLWLLFEAVLKTDLD